MYYLGTSHFNELRKAVGLAYAIGSRRQPAIEPVADSELAALLAKGQPLALAGIGFGGIAVIAFLMMSTTKVGSVRSNASGRATT